MISLWSHAIGSRVDLLAESHIDSQVRFSENIDLNKVRTSFLWGRPYMCSYFDLPAFILMVTLLCRSLSNRSRRS